MLIYKKEESINEDELYQIGINQMKEQFRFLRYSILIYPLIMTIIYYITKCNSLFFIGFFIFTECILMLGFLNYYKTIRYNDKLHKTEGIAKYIEKKYNDGDEETIISAIKVNGILFDIPNEFHNEITNKLIRLYYLNNQEYLVVGIKYL